MNIYSMLITIFSELIWNMAPLKSEQEEQPLLSFLAISWPREHKEKNQLELEELIKSESGPFL